MSKLTKELIGLDCIYAALMSDALGVPFEFKHPEGIDERYIDNPLSMPKSYKSYRDVPIGTISDDGSQILMLYNCIKDNLFFDVELINWYQGKYWTNGNVFDCGNQTGEAIRYIQKYGTPKLMPKGSGNGNLMRILPVAFLDYDEIKDASYKYSFPTHNSEDCLKASEFYCLLVNRLVDMVDKHGSEFAHKAFKDVWFIVEHEMNWNVRPMSMENIEGSGYVIDSLKLVYRHITTSDSFKDAITRSIRHGYDVDTNNCILAPVASLVFGLKDYPEEWDTMMKVNETNKYYTDLFGIN